MTEKKIRYQWDGAYKGAHYIRAWKVKRDIIVQVWLNKEKPEGEPEGDWEMPGVFGLQGCVEQAILQTEADNARK